MTFRFSSCIISNSNIGLHSGRLVRAAAMLKHHRGLYVFYHPPKFAVQSFLRGTADRSAASGGANVPMPQLKFRNYLAASRKPNMIAFGLYRNTASADLDVIEDNSSTTLAVTGVQDGTNATFTIPGALGALYVNGARQAPEYDYTVSSGGFTLTIPPRATDIILAFST